MAARPGRATFTSNNAWISSAFSAARLSVVTTWVADPGRALNRTDIANTLIARMPSGYGNPPTAYQTAYINGQISNIINDIRTRRTNVHNPPAANLRSRQRHLNPDTIAVQRTALVNSMTVETHNDPNGRRRVVFRRRAVWGGTAEMFWEAVIEQVRNQMAGQPPDRIVSLSRALVFARIRFDLRTLPFPWGSSTSP